MSERTSQQRKAFLPIGDEELDNAAERVALAKNIPTLTPPVQRPEDSAPRPEKRAEEASAPDAWRGSGAELGGPVVHREPGSVRSGFTQIRVRCPDHVSDQLVMEQQRLRREGKRVTLNYLILCALRKAGYEIDDTDLVEDGRRLRG